MSVVEEGVLFVQSGDVISGTVTDGQVLSAVLFGGFVGNEVWAAIVESGGTLVAADVHGDHSFAKSDRYRALRHMEIVAALGLGAGEMNSGHSHDDLL